MGNDHPKKNYNPKLEKQRFEIACIKVKAHLEIQRDRKMAQVNNKEKQLIQMISSPQRNMVEEVHKASAVVSDQKWVDGTQIVIRYCDILKDRSMYICESKGNPAAIEELMIYIESVIWSTKPLNLNCLKEFTGLMVMFFQQEILIVDNSPRVDPELKKCFSTQMPTDYEVNYYICALSQKTGIPVSTINQAGHFFSENPQPSGKPQGGFGGGSGGSGEIFQPPNQPNDQLGQMQPNQNINQMNPQYQNFGQVQVPQYPGQGVNININLPNQQGQQQNMGMNQQYPQQQMPSPQLSQISLHTQQSDHSNNQFQPNQNQQFNQQNSYPQQNQQFQNNQFQQNPNQYQQNQNQFSNQQYPQYNNSYPQQQFQYNQNQPMSGGYQPQPYQAPQQQQQQQSFNQQQPPQEQFKNDQPQMGNIDSLEARLERMKKGL